MVGGGTLNPSEMRRNVAKSADCRRMRAAASKRSFTSFLLSRADCSCSLVEPRVRLSEGNVT